MYDPNALLSPHYRLKDLTVTNQVLQYPNEPTSIDHYNNLKVTASILELLDQEIGDFKILSGYRTKELQEKLTAIGEPTSSGLSFHEIGRAVDITPTQMSLDEFFGRILANEDLKSQFAEIAVKHSQNSIHLSVNVPGDIRDAKILGLNQAGTYAKLTLDDIASYIAPYMASVEEAYDYAAAQLVTINKTPIILGIAIALSGLLYLALSPTKKETVA